MCHNLGIGLGFKMHSVPRYELFLKLHIVFYDSVVDDSHPAVFAGMGVSVDIRRRTVSGPAGMSDSRMSVKVLSGNKVFQVLDAAHMLLYIYFSVHEQGDSRRVIAAIL